MVFRLYEYFLIFVLGNVYNINRRNSIKFLLVEIPKPFLYIVRPFWFYDDVNDKYKANLFGVIAQIFILIPSLIILIVLSIYSFFNNDRALSLSDLWINMAIPVIWILSLTYLAVVIVYELVIYINKKSKKALLILCVNSIFLNHLVVLFYP